MDGGRGGALSSLSRLACCGWARPTAAVHFLQLPVAVESKAGLSADGLPGRMSVYPTSPSSPRFVFVLFFSSSLWTCGSPCSLKRPSPEHPCAALVGGGYKKMKGSRGRVGSGEAGLLALTGCGEVGCGGRDCCRRVHGGYSGLAGGWWLLIQFGMLFSPLSHLRRAHMQASSTGPSSPLLVKGISLRWRASGGCLPARSLSFFWNSVYIYSNDKGRNYFSCSNFMKSTSRAPPS